MSVARMPIHPDQFPRTGNVTLKQLSTHSGQLGMFPGSPATWLRMVDRGDAPEPIVIGRQHFWRCEHVRAIAAGIDWRMVKIDTPDLMATAAE
ncbi:hypothetical protein GS610_08140 [Ruegeria sp. HKCCD6228]|uniref:hypothetical protein n=1 Tax=Ruegeria sp. HKCCD6228 TaxID=2683001 RepID=UPI001491C60D|nr:hypothetical protein [Ruegeria sp. HKCCD6228]NOD97177.1 hypothetical protein [Ruegeria sp. HKCCD6228]